MAKPHDYTLGKLENHAIWTDLRSALGCLVHGTLTPTIIAAGEDGWLVQVRSRNRLSEEDIAYIDGFFAGFVKARI